VEGHRYLDPVDSKAVGYFLFICQMRSSDLAVVVAANGLTGDPNDGSYAQSLALTASASGCRLVVMTTADLLSLSSVQDLTDMLRLRWLKAWANGDIDWDGIGGLGQNAQRMLASVGSTSEGAWPRTVDYQLCVIGFSDRVLARTRVGPEGRAHGSRLLKQGARPVVVLSNLSVSETRPYGGRVRRPT